MIQKIKNKLGFSFRLYCYQIAMSLYTLMISIPVGTLVKETPAVKTAVVVFSLILYFVIIYFTAHARGEKDFVGRNNPINPPKANDGFVYAIVSQIINIVFIVLLLIPAKSLNAVSLIAMNFTDYMYFPVNYLVKDLSNLQMGIWYLVSLVPQVLVCGLSYMLGFKGIFISKFFKLDKAEIHSAPREDNPEFDK